MCTDAKVVAICGDGGFMMNSQELETAVRLKMNLVVLILRDNAYGMIKWKQAGMGLLLLLALQVMFVGKAVLQKRRHLRALDEVKKM